MVRESKEGTEVYFWVREGDQSKEVVMTLAEFLAGCKEPPSVVKAPVQAVQAVVTVSTPNPWAWMDPLMPKEGE